MTGTIPLEARMVDQACVYTAEEQLAKLLIAFKGKKDRKRATEDVLRQLNRIQLEAMRQGLKTRDIILEVGYVGEN